MRKPSKVRATAGLTAVVGSCSLFIWTLMTSMDATWHIDEAGAVVADVVLDELDLNSWRTSDELADRVIPAAYVPSLSFNLDVNLVGATTDGTVFHVVLARTHCQVDRDHDLLAAGPAGIARLLV